jgi:hypothetical protein
MHRLRRSAISIGVAVEIAVAVSLERSLAVEEIKALDHALVGVLDERAAAARTEQNLTGAAAVYLRQIVGGSGGAPTPSVTGPLSIPVRVAARLSGASDERLVALLEGDLALALQWERAAILENRTIAEWASWQALRLLSR